MSLRDSMNTINKLKLLRVCSAITIIFFFAAPLLLGSDSSNNKNYFPGEEKTEYIKTVKGQIEKIVEFTLRYVPSGIFTLQSGGPDIAITRSYFMAETEVTQELWMAVMGTNPSYFQGDNQLPADGDVQEKRPVERVNWYATIMFCNKLSVLNNLEPVYSILGSTNPDDWGNIPSNNNDDWNAVMINWDANGYRLPTEMEWVWAAMGARDSFTGFAGSDRMNRIGDYAWYSLNSDRKTHEVAKKLANELGLYDMSGNVYEWCHDWYKAYPANAQTDYDGALAGIHRVFRGGSWFVTAFYCAIAFRDSYMPSYRNLNLGFRFVRTAEIISPSAS